MIETTVEQCRLAYSSFVRINEETRLPQKAAWRVARLLNKLKPVVRSFEETQLKLYKDAGGEQGGRGIEIPALEREEGESAEAWEDRRAARREVVGKLNEDLKGLNDEPVEIDYDPLPISLFEDDEKAPADKRRQFSANDFANAGPFLTDEPDKK